MSLFLEVGIKTLIVPALRNVYISKCYKTGQVAPSCLLTEFSESRKFWDIAPSQYSIRVKFISRPIRTAGISKTSGVGR